MGLGLAHLRMTSQMRCLHFYQSVNSPLRIPRYPTAGIFVAVTLFAAVTSWVVNNLVLAIAIIFVAVAICVNRGFIRTIVVFFVAVTHCVNGKQGQRYRV